MNEHDHNPVRSWAEARTQLSRSLEFVGEKGQRSIIQSLAWIDELEDAGYADKLFLAQDHLALLLSGERYEVGVPVLVAEFDRFEPLVDIYFYKDGIRHGQEQLAGCEVDKAQPLTLTPLLRIQLDLIAKEVPS